MNSKRESDLYDLSIKDKLDDIWTSLNIRNMSVFNSMKVVNYPFNQVTMEKKKSSIKGMNRLSRHISDKGIILNTFRSSFSEEASHLDISKKYNQHGTNTSYARSKLELNSIGGACSDIRRAAIKSDL